MVGTLSPKKNGLEFAKQIKNESLQFEPSIEKDSISDGPYAPEPIDFNHPFKFSLKNDSSIESYGVIQRIKEQGTGRF